MGGFNQQFFAYPLLLEPLLVEKPWGGTRLKSLLNKRAPNGSKIGESWELADLPEGCSQIANGPYAGEKFGDLVRNFPREMCNVEEAPAQFPLLVKYIDATQNLSIQVHPSDQQSIGLRGGGRGKAECWYVIDCQPGAEVVCGLDPDVTPEHLDHILQKGSAGDWVQRKAIEPGSFVYLQPGTVHALLAGTLICEIQQSSDTTYRLYDWGSPRELHPAESARVSRMGADNAGCVTKPGDEAGQSVLVRNEFFEVELATWTAPLTGDWKFCNNHGLILNVVGGSAGWQTPNGVLTDRNRFEIGDTWFLPQGMDELKLDIGSDGVKLLMSYALELGAP